MAKNWSYNIKFSIKSRWQELKTKRSDQKKQKLIAQQIAVDNVKVAKKHSPWWYYGAVLLLTVGMVGQNYIKIFQGYQPIAQQVIENEARPSLKVAQLDEIASTNLAANLAESADLPVALNVTNLSTSVVIEQTTKAEIDKVISKPSIITLDSSITRGVKRYKVQTGDTVASVARANNISQQTIRWANDLKKTQNLKVNDEIKILPVNGILYKIKTSDTIDKIAKKYKADKKRIISFNDLEIDGIKAGRQIVIPGGVLPYRETPDYVAPVVRPVKRSPVKINNPKYKVFAGNRYSYGWCTWYAYNRFAQLNGRTIGSLWGNANTWDTAAASAGFSVTTRPTVGSIFQTDRGYWGHVGVVESVAADGTITISEMNGPAGWGVVGYQTWSPKRYAGYVFIK